MAWGVPRTWTNGEIVTQTMLNTDVRDNMRELWHQVAYIEAPSTNTNTTATEAAPLFALSAGAVTYAAVPTIVEAFAPKAEGMGANLFDDTTDLGRLTHLTAGFVEVGWSVSRQFTPTAASHTYKIGFWQTGGATCGITAGAGGVATLVPAFIRVWQKGGA